MPMHFVIALIVAAAALLLSLYFQRRRVTADRRERFQLARIAELASRGPREDY